MIKHFCDRCERPLEKEDRDPFIRVDVDSKIIVSAMAVHADDITKPIIDLCVSCIKTILSAGQPRTTMTLPTIDKMATTSAENHFTVKTIGEDVASPYKQCSQCGEMNHPARRLCWKCRTEVFSEKEVATSQQPPAPTVYEPSTSPRVEEVQPTVFPDDRPSPRAG